MPMSGLVALVVGIFPTSAVIVVGVSVAMSAEEMVHKECDYCQSKWQNWTMLAYSRYEVLQVGCWNCANVYNVIDGACILVGKDPQHFIFWKDLTRQWNAVVNKYAYSAKE